MRNYLSWFVHLYSTWMWKGFTQQNMALQNIVENFGEKNTHKIKYSIQVGCVGGGIISSIIPHTPKHYFGLTVFECLYLSFIDSSRRIVPIRFLPCYFDSSVTDWDAKVMPVPQTLLVVASANILPALVWMASLKLRTCWALMSTTSVMIIFPLVTSYSTSDLHSPSFIIACHGDVDYSNWLPGLNVGWY